jgi:hypothetical protein
MNNNEMLVLYVAALNPAVQSFMEWYEKCEHRFRLYILLARHPEGTCLLL